MNPMDEVRSLGRKLSNWGRWGSADEKGTVNFITPECIRQAASLVKRGEIHSLALPLDENGPMNARFGRFNPIHRMTRYGGESASGKMWPHHRSSDDMAILGLQSSTQWDSLAHVWYDDLLYNGYPANSINAAGAHHCGIANWVRGILGRGVLADVARFQGVDCLPPSFPITPEILDATLASQDVHPASGDILIVRTGTLGKWSREGGEFPSDQPGLVLECAEWLHRHEIAAICCDNGAVEVTQPHRALMAFHMVAIRDMGLALGELFVLEELAAACATYRTWEMLFCGAPLHFPRAVGTPLNPLAIL